MEPGLGNHDGMLWTPMTMAVLWMTLGVGRRITPCSSAAADSLSSRLEPRSSRPAQSSLILRSRMRPFGLILGCLNSMKWSGAVLRRRSPFWCDIAYRSTCLDQPSSRRSRCSSSAVAGFGW